MRRPPPGPATPARAWYWRIRLGLALSTAWLALGGAYISVNIGWSQIYSLDAATLGNFLEGAFAPPDLADLAKTGAHIKNEVFTGAGA